VTEDGRFPLAHGLEAERHEIRVLLPQREDPEIEREPHVIPFWPQVTLF